MTDEEVRCGVPACTCRTRLVTSALATIVRFQQVGWKHSVVSGLTLTQVSVKDWAQGGEDALAWSIRFYGLSKLEDTAYV